MTALLVPVEGPIELFFDDTWRDLESVLRSRQATEHPGLVRVALGHGGTERGSLVMSLDQDLPPNPRATEITALVSGGSYVQVLGAAMFEEVENEVWEEIIKRGIHA